MPRMRIARNSISWKGSERIHQWTKSRWAITWRAWSTSTWAHGWNATINRPAVGNGSSGTAESAVTKAKWCDDTSPRKDVRHTTLLSSRRTQRFHWNHSQLPDDL